MLDCMMTTRLQDALLFLPPVARHEPLPPHEFAAQIRRNALGGFSGRRRSA
jgi:hypothetical protein